MMKFGLLIVFLSLILLPAQVLSQAWERMSAEDYIRKYKVIAINEMNLYRIPASITLAQGLLETDNGNSELARLANNHFGIKCKNDWTGKTYFKDDDEKDECFRKYDSPYESYVDHSLFLTSRERYRFLFDLDIKDYRGWAKGLKTAGYATNPEYANRLIKIIEEHSLFILDDQYIPNKVLIVNGSEIQTDTMMAFLEKAVDSIPSESFYLTFRRIYQNNGVKLILARKNDSYYKIASDFNIYSYQIPKYNELPKRGAPYDGQIIYIERKKKKSPYDYHVIMHWQTMHDIGQHYAVRSKALYRMNGMRKGTPLTEGQLIRLNKDVPLP
ncbi:MAG: glucosaminidase domain-containing protein [Bacteroidales bacterium]|nr:glucosaminidase domain-containing protein [Bacteroidales bacterium]